MKSSDIPEYAKIFRRLSFDGWNYYVCTCYGDIAISKSIYNEVRLKNIRHKNKLRNKRHVLRNS